MSITRRSACGIKVINNIFQYDYFKLSFIMAWMINLDMILKDYILFIFNNGNGG